MQTQHIQLVIIWEFHKRRYLNSWMVNSPSHVIIKGFDPSPYHVGYTQGASLTISTSMQRMSRSDRAALVAYGFVKTMGAISAILWFRLV